MSVFDDRKNASETKYVMDAAKEFKAEARRNKILGQWAAELMGKDEAETKAYILQVITADMEEAGDDDVFRKLRADLDEASVEISDQGLRAKMAEALSEAREAVYGEDD
jgi:hypothetical protein